MRRPDRPHAYMSGYSLWQRRENAASKLRFDLVLLTNLQFLVDNSESTLEGISSVLAQGKTPKGRERVPQTQISIRAIPEHV